MPLIDDWLPRFDVRSHHDTLVNATPERTWRALCDVDFGAHPLVRLLMGIRAIPAFVSAPRETWRRMRARPATSIDSVRTVLRGDFAKLDEREGEDIVFGLTGRFWTPSGGLVPTESTTFRGPVPSRLARAAWSFRVEARGRATLLSTETRVLCGEEARAPFLRYWRVVGMGSGMIRRAILSRIRRVAEG